MYRSSMRRYFRFSLRAFLVSISLVAVLMATWSTSARRQREGVAWVREQRGHNTYDFGGVTEDGRPYRPNTKLPGPTWLRNLLGIDYFATVTGVILDNQTVYDLAPLKNLPRLESIGLMIEVDPNIDLSPLHLLKHLKLLRLDYTGLEMEQLLPLRAALPDCRIESHTDGQLNADPMSFGQE